MSKCGVEFLTFEITVDDGEIESEAIMEKKLFLAKDERDGTTFLVFTWKKPQADGFNGDITPDVDLDWVSSRPRINWSNNRSHS